MRRSSYAFSLLELLVSVAIVLALLALIAPLLATSRRRSQAGVEIEQLHQLGVAAGIYYQESQLYPDSVTTLVRAQLVPTSILYSPLDTTATGMANAYDRERAGTSGNFIGLEVDYKSTFFGLREFDAGPSDFAKYVEPLVNPGWLISLTESRPLVPGRNTDPIIGGYRRLGLDGLVCPHS